MNFLTMDIGAAGKLKRVPIVLLAELESFNAPAKLTHQAVFLQ
jgi:hypothetical protein